MSHRLTARLGIACLVVTALWIVLLIMDAAGGPRQSFEQALAHASGGGALFTLTYLNAALITLFAAAFMAGLYDYCRAGSPAWSRIALLFTPVYAAFNLFAYLSQLLIVPRLVSLGREARHAAAAEFFLRQALQSWPDSAVAALNSLAYAVLGVPSIIFGWLLAKKGPAARPGGILLAANGVACIAGTVGQAAAIPFLAWGTMAGGVLFLAALLFIVRHLLSQPR